MSKGYSKQACAGELKVSEKTIYAWIEAHKEFEEAIRVGECLSALFWEKQGIEGLYNTTDYDEDGKKTSSRSLNASVWIFNMKNRHKWRDKQPDENDVVVNNFSTMSDEQLDEEIAKLIKDFEKGKKK